MSYIPFYCAQRKLANTSHVWVVSVGVKSPKARSGLNVNSGGTECST
jgi:hypothetical protein